jgi:hypothetical protein
LNKLIGQHLVITWRETSCQMNLKYHCVMLPKGDDLLN